MNIMEMPMGMIPRVLEQQSRQAVAARRERQQQLDMQQASIDNDLIGQGRFARSFNQSFGGKQEQEVNPRTMAMQERGFSFGEISAYNSMNVEVSPEATENARKGYANSFRRRHGYEAAEEGATGGYSGLVDEDVISSAARSAFERLWSEGSVRRGENIPWNLLYSMDKDELDELFEGMDAPTRDWAISRIVEAAESFTDEKIQVLAAEMDQEIAERLSGSESEIFGFPVSIARNRPEDAFQRYLTGDGKETMERLRGMGDTARAQPMIDLYNDLVMSSLGEVTGAISETSFALELHEDVRKKLNEASQQMADALRDPTDPDLPEHVRAMAEFVATGLAFTDLDMHERNIEMATRSRDKDMALQKHMEDLSISGRITGVETNEAGAPEVAAFDIGGKIFTTHLPAGMDSEYRRQWINAISLIQEYSENEFVREVLDQHAKSSEGGALPADEIVNTIGRWNRVPSTAIFNESLGENYREIALRYATLPEGHVAAGLLSLQSTAEELVLNIPADEGGVLTRDDYRAFARHRMSLSDPELGKRRAWIDQTASAAAIKEITNDPRVKLLMEAAGVGDSAIWQRSGKARREAYQQLLSEDPVAGLLWHSGTAQGREMAVLVSMARMKEMGQEKVQGLLHGGNSIMTWLDDASESGAVDFRGRSLTIDGLVEFFEDPENVRFSDALAAQIDMPRLRELVRQVDSQMEANHAVGITSEVSDSTPNVQRRLRDMAGIFPIDPTRPAEGMVFDPEEQLYGMFEPITFEDFAKLKAVVEAFGRRGWRDAERARQHDLSGRVSVDARIRDAEMELDRSLNDWVAGEDFDPRHLEPLEEERT